MLPTRAILSVINLFLLVLIILINCTGCDSESKISEEVQKSPSSELEVGNGESQDSKYSKGSTDTQLTVMWWHCANNPSYKNKPECESAKDILELHTIIVKNTVALGTKRTKLFNQISEDLLPKYFPNAPSVATKSYDPSLKGDVDSGSNTQAYNFSELKNKITKYIKSVPLVDSNASFLYQPAIAYMSALFTIFTGGDLTLQTKPGLKCGKAGILEDEPLIHYALDSLPGGPPNTLYKGAVYYDQADALIKFIEKIQCLSQVKINLIDESLVKAYYGTVAYLKETLPAKSKYVDVISKELVYLLTPMLLNTYDRTKHLGFGVPSKNFLMENIALIKEMSVAPSVDPKGWTPSPSKILEKYIYLFHDTKKAEKIDICKGKYNGSVSALPPTVPFPWCGLECWHTVNGADPEIAVEYSCNKSKGKFGNGFSSCINIDVLTELALNPNSLGEGKQSLASIMLNGGSCSDNLIKYAEKAKKALYVKPPSCSYTYSPWETCQSNGKQARSVASVTPNFCDGAPILSQTCKYAPPPCKQYLYSEWGKCQSSGKQTRSVKYSVPSVCSGSPVLSQNCDYKLQVCNNKCDDSCVFGNLSSCGGNGTFDKYDNESKCQQGNMCQISQYCLIEKGSCQIKCYNSCKATGLPWKGKPKKCTYTYSDWGSCQSNGEKTRTLKTSSPVDCVGTPTLKAYCYYTPLNSDCGLQCANSCIDKNISACGGDGNFDVGNPINCNDKSLCKKKCTEYKEGCLKKCIGVCEDYNEPWKGKNENKSKKRNSSQNNDIKLISGGWLVNIIRSIDDFVFSNAYGYNEPDCISKCQDAFYVCQAAMQDCPTSAVCDEKAIQCSNAAKGCLDGCYGSASGVGGNGGSGSSGGGGGNGGGAGGSGSGPDNSPPNKPKPPCTGSDCCKPGDSSCKKKPECGNGIVETGEECDGGDNCESCKKKEKKKKNCNELPSEALKNALNNFGLGDLGGILDPLGSVADDINDIIENEKNWQYANKEASYLLSVKWKEIFNEAMKNSGTQTVFNEEDKKSFLKFGLAKMAFARFFDFNKLGEYYGNDLSESYALSDSSSGDIFLNKDLFYKMTPEAALDTLVHEGAHSALLAAEKSEKLNMDKFSDYMKSVLGDAGFHHNTYLPAGGLKGEATNDELKQYNPDWCNMEQECKRLTVITWKIGLKFLIRQSIKQNIFNISA